MPVLLVRHAAAGSRRAWTGDDAERPLDDRGRRQAAALAKVLAPFDVVRACASPAVRCVATVEPVAASRGLGVERDDVLFEGNGAQALALVRMLLAPPSVSAGLDGPTVVLCSHGDVIPEVLGDLEREGAALGDDRRCQKGSTWVLTVGPDGAVVGRYLPPAT